MGKTNRDTQHFGRRIDITRQDDGSFDLFLDEALQHSGFTEEQLAYELCVRFGYCQDEFLPIHDSLKQTGRAQLVY
jgi:hypothetical protein